MKIGTYVVRGPGSPEEKLHVIKEAGFDFVCLSRSMFSGRGATPELCRRAGIPFDNVHLTCSDTSLIWFPGEEGEAICGRYCSEIEQAAAAGVKTGIAHVTWKRLPVPPDDPSEGLRRYEKIWNTARRCGFTVAVENSAHAKPLRDVLDRFGDPFRFCFDSGHRNCFTPEEDFLADYGGRLAATHLHDNDGSTDLHMLPFDGRTDWDSVAKALAATPSGREKICAELVAPYGEEYPGMTAEQIAQSMSGMEAVRRGDGSFSDGSARFYDGIPYEKIITMLYGRMKRLGDMIEDYAAGNR